MKNRGGRERTTGLLNSDLANYAHERAYRPGGVTNPTPVSSSIMNLNLWLVVDPHPVQGIVGRALRIHNIEEATVRRDDRDDISTACRPRRINLSNWPAPIQH